MSDRALIALSGALLLLAAGVLAWEFAQRRQRNQAAQRHLAERLSPQNMPPPGAAPLAMPGLRFGAPLAPQAPPQPIPGARPAWHMPACMLGALPPSAAVAGLLMALVSVGTALAFSGWVSALGVLAVLLSGGGLGIWLRVQRQRRQMVHQLPGMLDAIVRLIVVGHSTQAAFQVAVQGTKNPLHEQMAHALAMVRAGMDVDQALRQVARKTRVKELLLVASILGLSSRYGGRSDQLLERVAHFMRDREEAEAELSAMSAETRLSAWVLGLLPVLVGGAIIATNADYFGRMWTDSLGRSLVFSAAGLQLAGALLLYRLARLD